MIYQTIKVINVTFNESVIQAKKPIVTTKEAEEEPCKNNEAVNQEEPCNNNEAVNQEEPCNNNEAENQEEPCNITKL